MRAFPAHASARHLECCVQAVNRDETELARRHRVAAARDEHGAEADDRGLARRPVREGKQGVAGAALAVRGECAGILRSRLLGGAELVGLAPEARRCEERAVGLLRGVVEPPAERVNEDRGAAVDDRERVAPELQRDAEAELRGVQRVRQLAGKVERRRWDPDDDRVERLLQHDLSRGDRAQEGLRVRDRGRPGEHSGGGQVSPERADHARAKRSGHDRERAP